jgi:hypothetical protein
LNPYDIPTMLLVAFITLVMVMVAVLAYIIHRSFPSRAWVGWGVLALLVAVPAGIALSGALSDMEATPPMIMRVVFPVMAVTLIVSLSPIGRKFAQLPIVLLVGIQIFRIPLEVMLHQLYSEGHLPVEMTWAGMNFDILSGLGALGIVLWSWRGEVPRWALWTWNVVGLSLLAVIVGLSIVAVPQPFGLFEVQLTIPTVVPFIWLPSFLVQLALFGHIVIFRHLWATRGGRAPVESTLSEAA